MCGWRDCYDKLKELKGESQVVPGSRFRVAGYGFRVSSSGFRVPSFGHKTILCYFVLSCFCGRR